MCRDVQKAKMNRYRSFSELTLWAASALVYFTYHNNNNNLKSNTVCLFFYTCTQIIMRSSPVQSSPLCPEGGPQNSETAHHFLLWQVQATDKQPLAQMTSTGFNALRPEYLTLCYCIFMYDAVQLSVASPFCPLLLPCFRFHCLLLCRAYYS
jgi:hypothetical protein